jgi:CRP/FNR family nitrogen fixation transcriptional regulator
MAIQLTDLAERASTAPPWAARPATSHGVFRNLPALHFSAEREIYAQGDPAACLYQVSHGMVRTCRYLSDGSRQVDAFYGPGDVFGFELAAIHGVCAQAVSDCAVRAYRRRPLQSAPDGTAMHLLAFAMQSLTRSREHALLLGHGSAAQKLASFLLDMAQRGPVAETVELVMTRQHIADYLGLTIETVSRTFSQFERDGLIECATARRIRLISRARLQGLNA